jgi:hypothetical protein
MRPLQIHAVFDSEGAEVRDHIEPCRPPGGRLRRTQRGIRHPSTLASVAAKTRANPRTRHLDLAGTDKAVTYLTNNHKHMKYDKALAAGWPIATGMIEGACRFVIEDRFGITGARWSPDGAEDILKLRAVVVNGDRGDYTTPQPPLST